MEPITQLLNEGGVKFSVLSTGEVFVRRSDGRGMRIRSYGNELYDWCIGQPYNDENYLELRAPIKQSESDALDAVRSFLREAH